MNIIRAINYKLEAQKERYSKRLRNVQEEWLQIGENYWKGKNSLIIKNKKENKKSETLEQEIKCYQAQIQAIDEAIETVFNTATEREYTT